MLLREDGSIFFIMGSPMELTYVNAFIFPDFNIVNEGTEESYKEQYYEFDRPESAIRIDEGSKWGQTIFYDMGKCDDMDNINADNYTMFLTKKDGTLWYWNSNRIKYISEYCTTEIKDIEYYNRANTNPDRTVFTGQETNMHLKALSFRRLEYNKIVRINTDGGYHFSLLDEGDYFHLDMTP